ncbi:MAG: substrate-binding domain-containing protein [Candidatus Ornithospirochaeta sp.]|nr:substrate-binding domain-containing protein [Candidatus Ornithospirochaeta sp.]
MNRILMMLIVALSAMVLFANGAKEDDSITVISREDGSGTRGAFIEIVGVEQKDKDGNKVDMTTENAEIANSTSLVISSVEKNAKAIGYISLGSLSDSVKALSINGAEPTVENIKSGSYKVSRGFNIAYMKETEISKDFISYIMSSQGQNAVEKKGYIKVAGEEQYKPSGLSGKLTISGSSSVYPVMEVLKEAYEKLNPGVEIVLQQSDSTTGINDAISQISDIGMASRDLKESELAKGLTSVKIAIDGIAVIVNKANAVSGLTVDQVKDIYTGAIASWSQVR